MVPIPVTLDASPDLVAGLASGSFTRIGGVVRESASGQIVAHLQEVGNGVNLLSSGVRSVAALGQIAAGASVLNLGVSAIGFAYTAYRLQQISKAIESLSEDVRRGFATMEARFDRVDQQLGYLVLLAEADQAVLATVRRDVSILVQHSVTDSLSEVVSELGRRATFGEVASADSVSRMERVAFQLSGRAASFTPSLDPEVLTNTDLCVQGWASSVALQAQMLEELGHLDVALRVLSDARSQFHALTSRWADALLGDADPALATAFRLSTPPLKNWVKGERVARIARHSPRDQYLSVEAEEVRKRDARVALEMSRVSGDEKWVAEQTVVATFLDLLAETADRVATNELMAVERERWGTASLETMRAIEAKPGLYVVAAGEMAA